MKKGLAVAKLVDAETQEHGLTEGWKRLVVRVQIPSVEPQKYMKGGVE